MPMLIESSPQPHSLAQQLNSANTSDVQPLTHPLDVSQRLRADSITEKNLREKFQRIAPKVEAGLYLVPKVIEEA